MNDRNPERQARSHEQFSKIVFIPVYGDSWLMVVVKTLLRRIRVTFNAAGPSACVCVGYVHVSSPAHEMCARMSMFMPEVNSCVIVYIIS